MNNQELKDHITKMCEDSYRQGQADFCKTFKETLKLMDSSGMGKHTTAQVLEFIDTAEKLTGGGE